MGQEIKNTQFTEADFLKFSKHLQYETAELEKRFDEKAFNNGVHVGGFELEAWLVDPQARPVANNRQFLLNLNKPEVVPELSLFNFEINAKPLAFSRSALKEFHESLKQNWQQCKDTAVGRGEDVMSIGIHPMIQAAHLVPRNMSRIQRYQAINEQILVMRQRKPMVINIEGRECLRMMEPSMMLEAAATSFQIHFQVAQDQAVLAHNASQIISAPLVAVSANSPYLLGTDLWDESRIPLFEQSVDVGEQPNKRVTFDTQYANRSLFEFFQRNLDSYPVLIPDNYDVDAESFTHLRLHNGTIWRWNRPLLGFDVDGQLHLRIENRVVPSGPTITDMMANAAFYWGLVKALIDKPQDMEKRIPFEVAKENFYAAARDSLNCSITWLDGQVYSCVDLVHQQLLPLAEQGLALLGIDPDDAAYYLGIIEARSQKKQNGAIWQRNWVKKNGRDMASLSQVYLKNQHSQRPVHEWDV